MTSGCTVVYLIRVLAAVAGEAAVAAVAADAGDASPAADADAAAFRTVRGRNEERSGIIGRPGFASGALARVRGRDLHLGRDGRRMLCGARVKDQLEVRRQPLRLESAELLRARAVMDDDDLVVVVDLRAKEVSQDELLRSDRGKLCKRERKLRFKLLTPP